MRFGLYFLVLSPLLASPTFYRDVLPIFEKHCQECHRPGQIAPFPLLTYQQARPWAKAIRSAVVSRKMPPWFAEPGHFLNDRSLSESDIETISAWASSGAPAGEEKDAPAPTRFTEGWRIHNPDVVLDSGVTFPVPERGDVNYQYFVVRTNFKQDKWIKEIEVLPGDRAVVHHVGVYIRPPGSRYMSFAFPGKAFEPEWDSFEPAPIRPGTSVRGLADNVCELLGVYVPGADPYTAAPGEARLVRAGSDLIFETHYVAAGPGHSDRTRVGLVFGDQPKLRVINAIVSNHFIKLPAGQRYTAEAAVTLRRDVEIRSIRPHMHLRGTGYEASVRYPSGKSALLLKLHGYDFNWQIAYEPAAVSLPAGSEIRLTGRYDNSPNNPRNPNPNTDVYWGEQSWQEMLAGFIDLAIPVELNPSDLIDREALEPESAPGPFGKGTWQSSARRIVQDLKRRWGVH